MDNQKTLQGVKVVELSTIVAASVCARMLGDIGAEVIKIEGFKGNLPPSPSWVLPRSWLP